MRNRRTMNILDVLFYCLYSFYRKILSDITPETSTITGLWVIIFGGVMTFTGGIIAPFGWTVTMIACFAVGIASVAILQRYFIKSGRWKRILKEKPIIKNKKVSVIITIAFAIIGILSAFGGIFLAKYIHSGCL